jgi:hypothetical protein
VQSGNFVGSPGGNRAGLFALWLQEDSACCGRLDEVQERFRRMVEEGRANKNDDYMIFRWRW